MKKIGAVYCIFDIMSGSVKIGFSQNVSMRIRELQSAHGRKLELLAELPNRTEEDEEEIHFKFRKNRLNGEWFELTNRMAKYFLEQMGAFDVVEDNARKQLLGRLDPILLAHVKIAAPPIPTSFDPLVVRPADAMRMLCCGRDRLYELLRQGELESYLDGRMRKITMSSIRSFMQRLIEASPYYRAGPRPQNSRNPQHLSERGAQPVDPAGRDADS